MNRLFSTLEDHTSVQGIAVFEEERLGDTRPRIVGSVVAALMIFSAPLAAGRSAGAAEASYYLGVCALDLDRSNEATAAPERYVE